MSSDVGGASPGSGDHSARVAQVVVDSSVPALDRVFEYAVRADLQEHIREGVRVKVPLARQSASGYVVGLAETAEFEGTLAAITAIVSPVAVLQPEILRLAREIAERQAGSVSDVLRLAIPSRMARIEAAFATEHPVAGGWHVNEPPGRAESNTLAAIAQSASRRRAVLADPGVRDAMPRWVAGLLRDLAENAARGHGAIVSVPDYRDVDRVLAALENTELEHRAVRYDARVGRTAKYRNFLRMLTGEALIVVGTRSALWAPVARLGLIWVWNDGDELHEEPHAPYAHSRDVALVRERQSGCTLVFASLSRSSDTQRLVDSGWLTDAPAPRAAGPIIPSELADRSGVPGRIPEIAFTTTRDALMRGPVLIQVDRAGESPLLVCSRCGERSTCKVCGGAMWRREVGADPECRVCGSIDAHPRCRNCGSLDTRTVGSGSRRTASDLGRAFPQARVVVSDGANPVGEVSGAGVLVVATRGAEPFAAEGYEAVVVLDGERLVARESLHAVEDAVRQWSGALALVREGARSVVTGVAGSLARELSAWHHVEIARAELGDRVALGFPPHRRSVTVSGEPDAVARAIESVRNAAVVTVIGPFAVRDAQRRAAGAVSDRAVLLVRYDQQLAVARILRAEVLRAGTRPRPVRGQRGDRSGRSRGAESALRVQFGALGVLGHSTELAAAE